VAALPPGERPGPDLTLAPLRADHEQLTDAVWPGAPVVVGVLVWARVMAAVGAAGQVVFRGFQTMSSASRSAIRSGDSLPSLRSMRLLLIHWPRPNPSSVTNSLLPNCQLLQWLKVESGRVESRFRGEGKRLPAL
jgi:hypothetical protein